MTNEGGTPFTSPREALDHHPTAREAQSRLQVSMPMEGSAQVGMKRKKGKPAPHTPLRTHPGAQSQAAMELSTHGSDPEPREFRIAFGFVCIYVVAAFIRMGNWTQNDTFRAAGDAAYGTILEIVFMWVMVLPFVYLTGMVWHSATLLVFACCYIDEPIRYILMQIHLFSGKWIKPVTPEGIAAMKSWHRPRITVRAK